MNAHALFRLVPVVALAALLASCSEDSGVSGAYVLPSILQFDRDTLYGTTQDEVMFEAVIMGSPASEASVLDFGDGGQASSPDIDASFRIAVPHLYSSMGTYTAVFSAGSEYIDTCIVVIQEYVRPSETKKLTVTISGLQFSYLQKIDYLNDENGQDTSWISNEDTFTTSLEPVDENLQTVGIPWDGRQSFKYVYTTLPENGTGDSTNYTAYVSLSPDGRTVAHIALLSDNYTSEDSVLVGSESLQLEIFGIPLDPNLTPSRTAATYVWSGTPDELGTYFSGLDYEINTYGKTMLEDKTLQGYTTQGNVTITVVFEE